MIIDDPAMAALGAAIGVAIALVVVTWVIRRD